MSGDHERGTRTPDSPPPPPANRPLWLRVVDAVFFGGALLLLIVVVSSTLAQPLFPMRVVAHLLLLPTAAIVFHRALAFVQRRVRRGSTPEVGRRAKLVALLKWLGAPVAAVVSSIALESLTLERGLTLVRGDLGPVVRVLETKPATGPEGVLEALGAAREVNEVRHFTKEGAFILATRGGSIDMDAETIYYDSRDRAWHRFHNDLAATDDPDAARFQEATRGVIPIRYQRHGQDWARAQPQ